MGFPLMVNEDGSLPSIDGSRLLNLPIGSGDMEKATYDPASKNAQLAALTDLAVDGNLSAAVQDAVTKKHANTLDHSNSLDHDGDDQDTVIAGKANASHGHAPADVTGTAVVDADARLSDARTPVSHDNTKHSAAYIIQADAVIPNAPITGAQKTKVTYDAKGLVTSGTDATAADVGAEASGAVATHAALTTGVHGVGVGTLAKVSDIADGDNLPGLSATKKGGAPATGTPSNKYLRDDGTWQSPPGGSEAFPVGSVFISVVSTNPATLLGYGTWSAIAAGRVLVGLNSGDIDFDTAEETGGAKTKTVAQANLPNISTGAGTSHNHTQDTHNHVITELRDATTGGATTNIALSADTSSTLGTKVTGSRVATNQAEATHTHSLGGSGTALDVMNPYFVVYYWKRTA